MISLETSRVICRRATEKPQKRGAIMGKSQSKMCKKNQYDKPVFGLMKKAHGEKCLKGIKELIKYHDFPEEGTLSVTRLTAVQESVEEGPEQKGCCVRRVCGL